MTKKEAKERMRVIRNLAREVETVFQTRELMDVIVSATDVIDKLESGESYYTQLWKGKKDEL